MVANYNGPGEKGVSGVIRTGWEYTFFSCFEIPYHSPVLGNLLSLLRDRLLNQRLVMNYDI